MRAKLTFLSALAVGTLGGVIAAGCQTYDFEPVDPLAVAQTTEIRKIEARNLKPNLMLLVDTSGSMTLPVDPSDPDCMTGSGLCGTATTPACNINTCPTRWSALQGAMASFLSTSGSVARMGLATYPDPASMDSFGIICGGSSSLKRGLPNGDDDASLQAHATAINSDIQSIPNEGADRPKGGTPTSFSLNYLGTLSELQSSEREDIVLLLTDGLPNCNPSNPNAHPKPECRCTLGDANTYCGYDPMNKLGCLDQDASVSAVQQLQDKGIKTVVIGFGAETATGGDGKAVLNGMALAGGYSITRQCTRSEDCGAGDTCLASGVCERRFYQAANQTELATALRQISERVNVEDPCLIKLDASERPPSQDLLVVYVDGGRVEPGADTWSLTAEGVSFTGGLCQRIMNSTPTNPVNIEVRAIQRR